MIFIEEWNSTGCGFCCWPPATDFHPHSRGTVPLRPDPCRRSSFRGQTIFRSHLQLDSLSGPMLIDPLDGAHNPRQSQHHRQSEEVPQPVRTLLPVVTRRVFSWWDQVNTTAVHCGSPGTLLKSANSGIRALAVSKYPLARVFPVHENAEWIRELWEFGESRDTSATLLAEGSRAACRLSPRGGYLTSAASTAWDLALKWRRSGSDNRRNG